ncbi:ankyrin [Aspergillus bertholletiae]|uniref:Ankyrin n=1 Tax=Aspergillus bertholletiae TaxID=1226010 RepID=A0A5N7AS90_9EURO|nr:ankyrin [Aspergillus bertholletiae]
MEPDNAFLDAFLNACCYGELSKVQEAIASGQLTIENLDEGLVLSTDSAHQDIVAALFNAGARVSTDTVDALPGDLQHPNVVHHFLNNGLDPNAILSNGEPLIAFLNNTACARELLSQGADPNRCGPRGISPLVRTIVGTCKGEDTSHVEVLLAYGAKLESDLLFAAGGPRVAQGELMTRFLLASGLNPNTTHAKWGTPLHLAIYSAKPNIVKLLLDAGADPTAVSVGTQFPGKNPSQAAETVRHPETRQTIFVLQ